MVSILNGQPHASSIQHTAAMQLARYGMNMRTRDYEKNAAPAHEYVERMALLTRSKGRAGLIPCYMDRATWTVLQYVARGGVVAVRRRGWVAVTRTCMCMYMHMQ